MSVAPLGPMIAPASSFCTTIEMIVVLFLAGGSSCAAATVVVGVVRRDRRRGPVVGWGVVAAAMDGRRCDGRWLSFVTTT